MLPSDESHHLKNVLRLKEGDDVMLFNGVGLEYRGNVAALGRRVSIKVSQQTRTRLIRPVSLALAQSLPKRKKMDFVIQKACELCLEEVYPVISEHSEFRVSKIQNKSAVERWERVAVQSCKQSQLDWIPVIHEPHSLKEFLALTKKFSAVFMPHPDESLPKMSEVIAQVKEKLRASKQVSPKIAVLIGPEGGFSAKEVEMAKAVGVHCVSLGDLVLRTETASIVAVALLKYSFDLC